MSSTATVRDKTIWLAIAMGLTTAAFIMAKTGRDALFFQGSGIFQLPVATMTIAAAALPLAMLFVRFMKAFGARPARVSLMGLAAAVMAAAAPFLQPGDSTLLFSIFIFIPAVFGIVFASLWLLASDILENSPKAETARAFSRVGAASLGSGAAGAFLAGALGSIIDPQWLILGGALMTAAAILVVVRAHQKFPPTPVPPKPAIKSNSYLGPIAKPYALTLLFISMSGALAGLFIEVQFYISATNANMDSKGNASFFATFYGLLNLGSLLLQLFATPKIQEKVGVRGGLMVLPFALLGSASFVGLAATALSLSVLRVTEGGIRSSVHRSIWEQAFIPVDSSERSVVKLTVDGIGARIAEGIAAAGLFVWLQYVAPGGVPSGPLDTRWMAWLTLGIVITWLVITHRLRVQQQAAPPPMTPASQDELTCDRFPDQCPCTTELGKDIR